VERYVGGGNVVPLNFVLAADDATEFARRSSIAGSAADAQRAAAERYAVARAAASALVGQAVVRLQEAELDLAHARAEAAAATVAVRRFEDAAARRQLLLDLVAAGSPVVPSDIPRLFLDAYQRAADALAVRRPACKVRWTALAAIGRVESNHGRSRGARVALNGDLWPVILGLPLDGTNNTRHIADTDGGEYDGDSVVDRAVGPMQFIPSTWTRVRLDGNGDGVLNPNNAYDATVTAAEYLCRVAHGGPLETDDALRIAFFSYNRSETYVERVLGLSHHYDLLAISGDLRP
jgi:membrane-bound lytic murein transglycosylase B